MDLTRELKSSRFTSEDEELIKLFNGFNKISSSFYETNSFLLKKKTISLIEYSAFFGSIQIFQFLVFNNVDLNDDLWFYAIHGKNAEIIYDLFKYNFSIICY